MTPKLIDPSATILNPDGSVYMTFPPAVESAGDLEGWMVHQVTSGTHNASCGHPGLASVGTAAMICQDVMSRKELLGLVGTFAREYGYRPASSGFGHRTFRWTFERVTEDRHRVSDMIIASKID